MKNYLKRIILLPALMFLLSLGLIGCGGDDQEIKSNSLLEYYFSFDENLTYNDFEQIKNDIPVKNAMVVFVKGEENNKEDKNKHSIKIRTKDNVEEVMELKYYKDDLSFNSISYSCEGRVITRDKYSFQVAMEKKYEKIMDTDLNLLNVLDKDAQVDFMNSGEFDKNKIIYTDLVMFDKIIKNISYENNKYDENVNLIKQNSHLFDGYRLSQPRSKEVFFCNDIVGEGLELEFNEDNMVIRLYYYDKHNRAIEIINNGGEKKFFAYKDRHDENDNGVNANSIDELVNYLKDEPIK